MRVQIAHENAAERGEMSALSASMIGDRAAKYIREPDDRWNR
jgi:hypothetical protein